MLTLEHLALLQAQHAEAARARVREFAIHGRKFAFNTRPALMGVVNLSPDSWYRESVCLSLDQAVRRSKALTAQGADIVDVGAESTLAHTARLAEKEQTSRLVPLVRELSQAGILVSVETYDLGVTRAALDAGAGLVNLTGTTPGIFKLVADSDAAVIICYVQGENVREVGDFKFATDPVGAMRDYFARRIEEAVRDGVQKLIIDPGMGFYYRNLQDSATRVRFQMRTFLQSFRLRTLGFPVCHALPHAFEYFGEEVRSAEPFFAVLAALGKTDLFRTHEVAKTKAVLDTLAHYSEPSESPQAHQS